MKPRLRKLTDEQWERIPYADKHYEISNYGRIRSFMNKSGEPRIIKLGKIRDFYISRFRCLGKLRTFLIHNLVAEMFIPRDSELQDSVIHIDGNKKNNNVSNLKWATKKETILHSKAIFNKKKLLSPENYDGKKLAATDVIQIKKMLARGIKSTIIAQLFAVSAMQISRIKNNSNWQHITVDEA
jgi:hypothetical protein